MSHLRPRRALSFIELLIVVAIVGVLVGMLLPAVQQTREAANQVICAQKLRQIGIATHSYAETFGYLPWSIGWSYYLIPFYEGQANINPNSPQITTPPGVDLFHCPSRQAARFRLDYAAYGSPGGAMDGNVALHRLTDGASHTAMLAERNSLAVASAEPPGRSPDLSISDTTGLSSTYLSIRMHYAQIVNDTAARDSSSFKRKSIVLDDGWQSWQTPPYSHYVDSQYYSGSGTTYDFYIYAYSKGYTVEQYIPQVPLGFGAAHPRSMNMLMCDGSVQHFVYGRPGLRNVMIRNDGAAVSW